MRNAITACRDGRTITDLTELPGLVRRAVRQGRSTLLGPEISRRASDRQSDFPRTNLTVHRGIRRFLRSAGTLCGQTVPYGRDEMSDELALDVQGLAKAFGGHKAVDGIDLRLPRRSVLALLGPNGSGKTTTVRVLSTVLRPDSGRVRVMGHDVVGEPDAVRAVIGVAGQNVALDDRLTARENLRLAATLSLLHPREVRGRVDEMVERFGLGEFAHRRVRTLSGGIRRRVDLAAAMVHRPALLFFDEPTAGLDPHSRQQHWSLVSDMLRDGATLLLTTQQLEEADRLADRVVLLDHGRVVVEGRPDELKERLGTSTVVLHMVDSADAASAVALLEPDFAVHSRELKLEIPVADVTEALHDMLGRLRGAGLAPRPRENRPPSLGDVILALTGPHTDSPADTGRKEGA